MKSFIWYRCLVLVALVGLSLASIEKEPVKVTRQNSGPRYDFDEVEKIKLSENQPQQPPAAQGSSPQDPQGSEGENPITGHVTLRRIFLIPIMHAPGDTNGEQERPREESGPGNREGEGETIRRTFEFRNPFTMFRVNRPDDQDRHEHPMRHLLGQDEASRPMFNPPKGPEGERESSSSMERPIPFDPFQMMIGLMHHALQESAMRPPPSETPANPEDPMNKEASGAEPPKETNERDQPQVGSIERPVRPFMPNETKEEIVEIEGKKYLRKTMLTRHVGENFVFMTRRLLFVPLNETEAITTTTSTPANEASPSTLEPLNRAATSEPSSTATGTSDGITTTPSAIERETSTSTTTTSAPPTTTTGSLAAETQTTAASSSTTSTEAAPTEEMTTSNPVEVSTATRGNGSLLEKVSEAIDKAAERLVEGAAEMVSSSTTTTTERPSVAAA